MVYFRLLTIVMYPTKEQVGSLEHSEYHEQGEDDAENENNEKTLSSGHVLCDGNWGSRI